MFENRVLREIFGPKDKVTGNWRKLHNVELNDLYCSPNIVRVIKIEKNEMVRACSTQVGQEVYRRIWWRNLREKDHLEDPGIEGRIILN